VKIPNVNKRGCNPLLLLLVWLLPGAGNAQGLTALQLDASNIARRVGGHDAIAGVGDWLLSNGVLCAAISGADHQTGLSLGGGALVDLGHCDRADDQLSYTHLLPQMEQRRIVPVVAISASETETDAAIIVERSDGEIHTLTRYSVDTAMPQRLSMTTRIQRVAVGEDLSLVGQLWLHPRRAMTPFSVDTRGLVESLGFTYPSLNLEDRTQALQAMHKTDINVLVGEANAQPGISYAIRSEPAYLVDVKGKEQPVEQFTLVEEDYTNQIWMVRPLWFGGKGNPGRLEMLQSLFMDLNVGETLQLEQSVYVGAESDVASATNLIYQGSWLHGKLDVNSGRVAVFDDQGRPLTEAKVNPQGAFSIRLPRGLANCELVVTTPWSSARRLTLAVTDNDHRLPVLETGAPGWLNLPSGSAMRLVFVGLEGTADPVLGEPLPSYRFGDQVVQGAAQSNTLPLTGLASDPVSVALAPGDYRVYASRGLEYSVTSQDIRVVAGAQANLKLKPPRKVVDTDGWISADFHVHSGYSFDATISPRQRLASFVAQGADLLVATEHDYVADLGRIASAMGLDTLLTVVSGVEVTGMAHSEEIPATLGHINLYPWQRDDSAFAGGVPLHEGKRLRQLIAEVKARPDPPLVQLNHPRDLSEQSKDMAFFEHLSIGERYDQRLPLNNVQNRSLIQVDADSGLRDIDFDTYELANGAERQLYQLARADWLALILQGEYRPALANSDSHDLHSPVAMPRSYVAYSGEREHPLKQREVMDRVREGKVFGSSGPIPELVLRDEEGGSAGIGESLSGQRFTLQLSAEAAPWVNVDQVWIYVNGIVVKGGEYSVGDVLEIPIVVSQDSFVFVEFYGEPSSIYAALAPGHKPMAFTNPVWIDADGDGRWTPPGLATLPMAVSLPHSIPSASPH
jgi:hypothetical protein